MIYSLVFKEDAKKEWDELDHTIRSIFLKKLKERIKQPGVESARLSGMTDGYKIKLSGAGYRLVYQVRDRELVVSVIAIGKRERNRWTMGNASRLESASIVSTEKSRASC
ncbi:MAG TPA: type II toxin-antitoxin system RelE/ParE family toxin [Gammaproteobacteria bacterium]|nr:type II toxin-antitoxin system RelE/ParE family toxin [Gammaproteobacteria bacterium]